MSLFSLSRSPLLSGNFTGDGDTTLEDALVDSRVDSRVSVPAPVQRSLPPPPQQPIKAAPSSSRSRGARNSSLSDLHADDIIKQLTMNAD